MGPFRILHLSDIHIGDTYIKSEEIAYKIISAIEGEGIKNIRCILVTGDIFEGKSGYSEEIINEAVNFFDIIYKELKTNTIIEKTDFLFVPGNHDIIRSNNVQERWEKYGKFLSAFYGSIPLFYDKNDFSLVKAYDESKIVFVGFNSCGLEKKARIDVKQIENIAKIPEEKFEKLNLQKDNLLELLKQESKTEDFVDFGEITHKQILEQQRKLSKLDDYNIVSFFHHHFYLFPEVYKKCGDSGLIRDYTAIMQHMQQLGVKTVLHGHKHFDLERPSITDSYYDNANNVINVIAGGSVGSDRVVRHTFSVLDFCDKENDLKIVQKKFVYNSAQLEPVIPKQFPPQNSHNSVNVQLYNCLKFNNSELYIKYMESKEKINIVADDYENMDKWLENILMDFNEVSKIFISDSLCIFFLLFAMNYRILSIKNILGKDEINDSYFEILKKLIKSEQDNIDFDIEKYLEIFDETDLNKVKDNCDWLLNSVQNRKTKKYLAFSMISIFVTDIYLMLRYYADNFYNKYIKYKVNISLNENEFHQDVPVQKIMIHSDADRRSAYIDLRCNSATAHKLAVLFVKEFELIISKYEDYFKIVGLKLYYITPKIEKGDVQNAIDNYNFEAYIPTLIPLLTGDNIYARKEVFSRELVQNSIDAIAIREAQGDSFDNSIYISIDKDISGRIYFKIQDHGTGMDRFKIERYFTSIGRSFYSGDEYRDLELDYKPISSFGIGFLSTFMICREIDVKTKYYLDENEGLKLHIPNYDGCFFIEKDEKIDIGTEITLYIDEKISHGIKAQSIIDYLCNVMRDINYDINIKSNFCEYDNVIASHSIRKNGDEKGMLFVPFLEDGTIRTGLDLEKDIWSGDYIKKYSYGLIVNLSNEYGENFSGVLNSGILLSDITTEEIWSLLIVKKEAVHFCNDKFYTFNFPSNYLKVDVSREKITDFMNAILEEKFAEKLLKELYIQISQLITLAGTNNIDIKAVNLQLLIKDLCRICKNSENLNKVRSGFSNLRYLLNLRFKNNSLELIVSRNNKRSNHAAPYTRNNLKKLNEQIRDFVINTFKNSNEFSIGITETINSIKPELYRMMDVRNRFVRSRIQEDMLISHFGHQYYHTLMSPASKKMNDSNDEKIFYIILLILSIFDVEINKHIMPMQYVLDLLLQRYSISDIETKECSMEITAEDINRVIGDLKKGENDQPLWQINPTRQPPTSF